MKYFIDTEFIEGTQKGIFKDSKPTIDLISIGIVSEDGREYYAISKDFNIKEAWNRYDEVANRLFPIGPEYNRVYWLRENVCKPIFLELATKNNHEFVGTTFTYKLFKKLIKKYGKTNKEIAEEIIEFCSIKVAYSDFGHPDTSNVLYYKDRNRVIDGQIEEYKITKIFDGAPEFYADYCNYDWVVFCWLFGKMIDLPQGFPMFCRDTQQMLEEYLDRKAVEALKGEGNDNPLEVIKNNIRTWVETHPQYPLNQNLHDALEDARWTKRFYEFIKVL